VPVAVISREDGLELRQQIRSGTSLKARLNMRNTVGVGVARNVIATIMGSKKPEQIVVLGGHLDSLDLGTGAVDNGSGAMWILDVARAFARHHVHPQRTVQFIFFMGEEEGLLGSYAHVRNAAKDGTLARVRYMINTDMSVNPNGLYLWGGDLDARFFQTFAASVRKIYPSFTEISSEMASMSQSSDSQPFIEHGVPIIYPKAQWSDGLKSCIHAECDKIGFLDESQLRRSAVVGVMLLKTLADAPDSVAHVMTPAETLDYFKTAKITRGYLGPAENR
jgi:carboxypeptidase Q